MPFDPKKLPETVYEAYKQGPIAWMLAVQRAIKVGITDINKLTDIVFFIYHPELNGRPLKSNEVKLITEWKNFRSLVKPILVGSKFSDSLEDIEASDKMDNFQIQDMMSIYNSGG